MLIVSWNVNGIRAAVKKNFVDFLKTKKPDILGIQEVKIDNEKRKELKFSAQGGPASGWDFKNYTEHWYSSARPGYSGTMTLTKEKSIVEKTFVEHKTGLGHKEFDYEGRVQTLEFKKFFFVNAYFPNSRDDLSRIPFKQDFNKLILKHIKKLDKKKPVILVGDFNVAHEEIDIARPKPNDGKKGFTKEERTDFSKFIKNNFTDTFRTLHPDKIQYSWWSYMGGARKRNVGWRIDYIVVSKRLMKKVKKAFIWDQVQGSDHCPVGIEIDI